MAMIVRGYLGASYKFISKICSSIPLLSISIIITHTHLQITVNRFTCAYSLGSYHFLPGGGGRLSVMAGRQFFLVPPFAYAKKFWSPPLPTAKNFGPPL